MKDAPELRCTTRNGLGWYLNYSLVIVRAEGEEAGQRVQVERWQREGSHVVGPERLSGGGEAGGGGGGGTSSVELQPVVRRVVGDVAALHLHNTSVDITSDALMAYPRDICCQSQHGQRLQPYISGVAGSY